MNFDEHKHSQYCDYQILPMEQYSKYGIVVKAYTCSQMLAKTPHYFDAKNSFGNFPVSHLNANIFHMHMPDTIYGAPNQNIDPNQVLAFSVRFVSLQSSMLITCGKEGAFIPSSTIYHLYNVPRKWQATNEN